VLGSGAVGLPGYMGLLLFLGVLVGGFVYEWNKGALDWNSMIKFIYYFLIYYVFYKIKKSI
jgi:hypothetical protein